MWKNLFGQRSDTYLPVYICGRKKAQRFLSDTLPPRRRLRHPSAGADKSQKCKIRECFSYYSKTDNIILYYWTFDFIFINMFSVTEQITLSQMLQQIVISLKWVYRSTQTWLNACNLLHNLYSWSEPVRFSPLKLETNVGKDSFPE